ncbi:6419_t:CDS:1, partial [Racocetra fulgida]
KLGTKSDTTEPTDLSTGEISRCREGLGAVLRRKLSLLCGGVGIGGFGMVGMQ